MRNDSFSPNKPSALLNPGNSLFSWIGPTLRSTDETFIENAGLDALLFLKLLRFCTVFFCLASGLSVLGLIPLNVKMGKFAEYGLHSLSVGSIPEKDALLWVPAVGTAMLGLLGLWMMYNMWSDYTSLRRSYLTNLEHQKKIHNRTVMVSNIPPAYRNEDALREAFDRVLKAAIGPKLKLKARQRLYSVSNGITAPSIVERAYLDREVSGFQETLDEREGALERLEVSLVRFVREYQEGTKTMAPEHPHQSNRSLMQRLGRWSQRYGRPKEAEEAVQDIVSMRNQVLGQSISVDALSKVGAKLDSHAGPSMIAPLWRRWLPSEATGLNYRIQRISVLDSFVKDYRSQHAHMYEGAGHASSARDETVEEKTVTPMQLAKFNIQFPVQSTAFVTLQTRAAALLFAGQGKLPIGSLETENEGTFMTSPVTLPCTVEEAPEPRELLWRYISVPEKNRLARKTIIALLVGLLVIFYLVPVYGIISLTDPVSIAKYIPAVRGYEGEIWLKALTETVIPTVLITVCMTLLFGVLRSMSLAECPASLSKLDHSVMTK